MTAVRAVLAAAVVLGVVVVGGATSAHACSCALRPGASPTAGADVVFIGHTTQSPPADPTATGSRYDFVVDEVLKGEVGPLAVVGAENQPSACGVIFVTGRRYVVVAEAGEDDVYRTGLCTGTGRATPQTLERLGFGDPPGPVDADPAAPPEAAAPVPVTAVASSSGLTGPEWLLFGVGVTVLVVGSILGLRRMRTGG